MECAFCFSHEEAEKDTPTFVEGACECKGTLGYIHGSCLKRNILSRNRRGLDAFKCPTCKGTYDKEKLSDIGIDTRLIEASQTRLFRGPTFTVTAMSVRDISNLLYEDSDLAGALGVSVDEEGFLQNVHAVLKPPEFGRSCPSTMDPNTRVALDAHAGVVYLLRQFLANHYLREGYTVQEIVDAISFRRAELGLYPLPQGIKSIFANALHAWSLPQEPMQHIRPGYVQLFVQGLNAQSMFTFTTCF